MSLPIITLSGAELSDVFFNADHACYNALFAGVADSANDNPTDEDFRAALFEDAQLFAEYTGNQVTAEELTEDFWSRV